LLSKVSTTCLCKAVYNAQETFTRMLKYVVTDIPEYRTSSNTFDCMALKQGYEANIC
jgi:hypothetical protein